MSVELRDRQYQEPKEIGECFDCVEEILSVVFEGQDPSSLIGKLMDAYNNISQVGEEIKHESIYQASGAFSGRCAKIVIESVKK